LTDILYQRTPPGFSNPNITAPARSGCFEDTVSREKNYVLEC
jgi:hypothetical protein